MQAKIIQTPEAQRAPASAWARGWDAWPVWQSAIAAWIGQRLLIGALVALWQALLGGFSPVAFYRVWGLFDGIWYSLIARYGYHILPEASFFPLYPLLMRLTAPLAGGHVTLAGILLANGCSLAAFVLLGRLVEREFGAPIARRTLLYYALFPSGLFFMTAYTEGLFLLLSVGAFLAMRQRRWLLCGALIALATLTRAQGALLLAPVAIEAWEALRPAWATLSPTRQWRTGFALVSVALAPALAFLAFQVYLAQVYHMPDVLRRAAATSEWQRSLDWPWVGVVGDLVTLATGGAAAPRLEIIKDFVFLAFWLGLCVVMVARFRPKLPRSWVGYSWVSLAPVFLTPAHLRGGGLMSVPRFALVVFPCFALMALLGERYPRAHRLMVALCIAWAIILTRLLAGAMFVA